MRVAPDYYEPVQNIALLFSQTGRFDEAAAAFERLHFLKPDSKAVLLGLDLDGPMGTSEQAGLPVLLIGLTQWSERP